MVLADGIGDGSYYLLTPSPPPSLVTIATCCKHCGEPSDDSG